jgi:hypothetical protein
MPRKLSLVFVLAGLLVWSVARSGADQAFTPSE